MPPGAELELSKHALGGRVTFCAFVSLLKKSSRDFPDGPVAETP